MNTIEKAAQAVTGIERTLADIERRHAAAAAELAALTEQRGHLALDDEAAASVARGRIATLRDDIEELAAAAEVAQGRLDAAHRVCLRAQADELLAQAAALRKEAGKREGRRTEMLQQVAQFEEVDAWSDTPKVERAANPHVRSGVSDWAAPTKTAKLRCEADGLSLQAERLLAQAGDREPRIRPSPYSGEPVLTVAPEQVA